MIFIALGSNMDFSNIKPLDLLILAIEEIKKLPFEVKAVSSFYISDSWPNKSHPQYINCVIKGLSNLLADDLLDKLLEIENKFGRVREYQNSPRTLDIDIIDYDSQVINTNKLILPHPRMADRVFILKPMLDIEPNWIHPIMHKSAKELFNELNDKEITRIK